MTCVGVLVAKGSGNAVAPIVLGAYGAGTQRPVINGNGADTAVYLKDVSYWKVTDLRVTNPSSTRAQRNGVKVESSSTAAKAGIEITGLEVDNVAGWGDKTGTNAGWFILSSGIMVYSASTAGPISGLKITNNYVHDTGGGGIKISNKPSQYHTGVLIAGNSIISVGGDGIVVHGSDAPLVERNRFDNGGGGAYPFVAGNFAGMWAINSRDPLFQFNEVTRQYPSNFDSTAWDCDGGIVGTCTYQYNFSHNNGGGFFLGCQGCTSYPNYAAKQIIRFNISQDDCRIAANLENSSPTEIYNNTFYCMSRPLDLKLPTGTSANTKVANNIFVAAQGSLPTGTNLTYQKNLYWGGVTPPAGETGAVQGDPKLSFPGGTSTGFNSANGYRLSTGSPALGAGNVLSGLGARDYFGTPVPNAAGNVNIGADNGSGVPPKTFSSLGEAFNNVGISRDDNPRLGGYTLSGRSYSGEALELAGFRYGTVNSNGTSFGWPQRYYGFPDNVKAAGQTISVSRSGSRLAFIGSGTYGTQSGTGTVRYTDGTSANFTLTFADWLSTSAAPGTSLAAAMTYHHKPPSTYNNPSTGRDEADVNLWYAAVPLNSAKTVASVTLPSGSPLAGGGLHIFAMTVA
ncbi:right-handed parallel beta-helix repeat-containing protein [Micromonospora mirobrigensis]|uniref:right-handed parallel beta-helix repeat-containing protein n=1 Tax=Micromonospora mirobrigensis TaxID=262898 RepID=UPI00159F0B48|nr:right-handed parallel beta-helix repeat-containing protein [Micromonospora mirobrigensis]